MESMFQSNIHMHGRIQGFPAEHDPSDFPRCTVQCGPDWLSANPSSAIHDIQITNSSHPSQGGLALITLQF